MSSLIPNTSVQGYFGPGQGEAEENNLSLMPNGITFEVVNSLLGYDKGYDAYDPSQPQPHEAYPQRIQYQNGDDGNDDEEEEGEEEEETHMFAQPPPQLYQAPPCQGQAFAPPPPQFYQAPPYQGQAFAPPPPQLYQAPPYQYPFTQEQIMSQLPQLPQVSPSQIQSSFAYCYIVPGFI